MARPTLYLLPGLLCDGTVWETQAAALSEHWEVRIPLFRGLDSFDAMARAVLDDAPATFALAGHSMGGRVALEVIAAAADRVERLALLDTGVHGVRPGEAADRQQLLDLAAERGMAAVARAWAPPMVHPARRDDATLMNAIYAMVERYAPAEFHGQVRALLGRRDATPLLPDISCPTLVLCGREDDWSPPAQHEEIAAAIPGAVLEVVEDCGHMATMERPGEVTGALRRWLEDAPAATAPRRESH
jgi:pimeloyl-ACP methyl ester carboxylesterase